MAAFLPFIFLWYIGCVSLTPHTHIVDGVTIVHSHPASAEGHQHTAEETIGIELISHFDRDLGQDGVILPVIIITSVPEVVNCFLTLSPHLYSVKHGYLG